VRRGPPRRVCGQARWFFFGTSMGVFCRSIVGAEGSTIMCERLAGDSSRWRSSGGGWSLQRVAASGVLYVGDNDAVCGGFS
jgi:hypothetical protein